MRIRFVFPPLGHAGAQVRSMPLVPPVLEYLAGLTTRLRPGWDVAITNANVEPCSAERIDADVVGLSVLTHQASWAYRTADALRARGVKVLLGGPHPSVRPDEAQAHCDAVVVGEAESVLERVFSDLEAGRLLPRYEGTLLPLDGMPTPRRDLAKAVFHSFSTSRGCPYDCGFCATPGLHGTRVRHRPIGDVVADVASFDHKLWFCTDADAWGPDVRRSAELFREMATSLPRIHWVGEASIASVQHPAGGEMLRWARRSGLMQVWIGWESFSDGSLAAYGATAKMLSAREDALKRIRDAGIDVVLFLMLGARDEPLEEYARALEACDRLRVTPHPVMFVPYPGTPLYDALRGELGCGDDWDQYDGLHSVVRHTSGDGALREALLMALWHESFSYRRILRRMANLSWRGFPSSHIASGIVQSALRTAFRQHAASSGGDPGAGALLRSLAAGGPQR